MKTGPVSEGFLQHHGVQDGTVASCLRSGPVPLRPRAEFATGMGRSELDTGKWLPYGLAQKVGNRKFLQDQPVPEDFVEGNARGDPR